VASCELFADGGEVVMTDIFFPGEEFSEVKLVVSGGEVEVRGEVYEMVR
jgi:sucrose-6-phosphate hydrolase SacC (GH32 family)